MQDLDSRHISLNSQGLKGPIFKLQWAIRYTIVDIWSQAFPLYTISLIFISLHSPLPARWCSGNINCRSVAAALGSIPSLAIMYLEYVAESTVFKVHTFCCRPSFLDDRVSHDRPLRSGQVTVTPIGGHGSGHGHWVYDRVMRSRSCQC
jgi:hypothetical protein